MQVAATATFSGEFGSVTRNMFREYRDGQRYISITSKFTAASPGLSNE